MPGLNHGYSYTIHRQRHKNTVPKPLGNPTIGRPVKVFNAITKELIINEDKISIASTNFKVPEETIRYHCKKNANKYIDECVIYNEKYIFQFGEEPLF